MDRTNDHKKLGLIVPRVTLALNQLLNKVQIGPGADDDSGSGLFAVFAGCTELNCVEQ